MFRLLNNKSSFPTRGNSRVSSVSLPPPNDDDRIVLFDGECADPSLSLICINARKSPDDDCYTMNTFSSAPTTGNNNNNNKDNTQNHDNKKVSSVQAAGNEHPALQGKNFMDYHEAMNKDHEDEDVDVDDQYLYSSSSEPSGGSGTIRSDSTTLSSLSSNSSDDDEDASTISSGDVEDEDASSISSDDYEDENEDDDASTISSHDHNDDGHNDEAASFQAAKNEQPLILAMQDKALMECVLSLVKASYQEAMNSVASVSTWDDGSEFHMNNTLPAWEWNVLLPYVPNNTTSDFQAFQDN